MSYCSRCGIQIEDGNTLCPACRAGDPSNVHKSTAKASADTSDALENKTMAILAYLSFLVLIPVFMAKESRFARYHANQGLVLALFELAYGIVSTILSNIATSAMLSGGGWLRAGSWGIWSLVNMLLWLGWVLFGILSLMGVRNALNGRCKPLPVIGSIKISILK